MEKQLKCVIVGGVAGGMSAAARLRRLDEHAEIIVLEAGPEVSFANCGLPYFVGGEITDPAELLVQTPESLRASLNIDVRVNHQVTSLDAENHIVGGVGPDGPFQIGYDQLVLSPGASAMRPPIPGLDNPRVHTLRTVGDALAMRGLVTGPTPAQSAVVLGAGFIGLEAAEALRLQRLDVTVVEMAPHVLPPLETEMANLVQDELRRLGIGLAVGVSAQSITDAAAGVTVTLSDGRRVPADLVVLSAGVAPASGPFADAGLVCDARGAILVDDIGRTNLKDVWAVGDATASIDAVTGVRRPVPLAGPANRDGRIVADNIVAVRDGRPGRPFAKPLGSAIVRIGGLTVAMTGANRASLQAAGIEFTTIHTHPLGHAAYFPGAKQVHLMVHMGTDGRLLGAQGVGAQNVDKRIDVLATAMRGGLTVPELIDLDLCYSPPYGSAKDPVNMIGYLADNVLTGRLALWQPAELDWARREAFLLDVRSATEFAAGHVPEAVNVPHTQLRARLDEVAALAAGRPIAITCQSGVRSYLAHRVLEAAGLPSRSLSGGMLTLRQWLGEAASDVVVKDARP